MSTFFSTILAIFMSILSVILPAKPDNVIVTVRPVTTETAIITFECENNTRRTISRPYVTSIEKKTITVIGKTPMLLTVTQKKLTPFVMAEKQ